VRRQVAAAAAVTMLGCMLHAGPAHAAGNGYTSSYRTIPGHGGTPIKALVYRPKGHGPFPLIVMPASWSLFHAEYAGAAARLASRGYEVIAYTTRGFWDSEGRIEAAGRADIGDMSRIIDWAVAHGDADESRVGAAGISYGGGIPLLAAAFDKRIRAVSSMSSWASLSESLYLNRTLNEQAAGLLLGVSHVAGRPGDDLLEVQDGYLANEFGRALELISTRGAAAYVGRINANRPAILISGGWQDGVVPPGQNIDFFNRLTVPKRLVYQPGDHATTDILGAIGLLVPVAYIAWEFLLHDYQRQRVLTFLDPQNDPLGAGYHIIQSQIAIGSGGVFGKGYLDGSQAQLEFLPERSTDFIFAVIGEEWGLIGLVTVLLLFMFVVGRALYLAAGAQDTFARLASGSLALTFCVYVFVNSGMVIGLLPVVGVPLPLVSYGGTAMVTLMAGFGILMSLCAKRKLVGR